MVALFVILFVVVLLTIDLIIQKRSKRYPLMARVPQAQPLPVNSALVRLPKGVYYHPGHTWARMESGSSLTIGIDDFIQKAMGVIDRIVLPKPGQRVAQGDPVITVQRGSKTLTLVAPVSGVIYQVNNDVVDNPALVMDNPYEHGWLFMMEPEQLASNLSALAVAESAVAWLKNETLRFRDFLTVRSMEPALAESMADGGLPVHGALELLDDDGLKAFEQEFLRNAR
jgi:glycine cleavage system H lipoate-binding protein